MDETLAKRVKREIADAKTTEQILHAVVSAIVDIVDCQSKSSERIKHLLEIEAERKARIDATTITLRIVWGVASGGGFLIAAKIAKGMGVL